MPKIHISEASGENQENKLEIASNATYHPMGRKNDEFLEKQIIKTRYPSKESDLASLTRRKIDTNLFSYDLVSNWDDLNREIVENRIDCSICYSLIFFHKSISDRMGPLAYQCNLCQSNIICHGCQEKLTKCPFCKRTGSIIEPASSFILNEIKKIKFKCKNGCEISLRPREMLQHYAF